VAITRVSNVAYITGFEHLFDDEEAHVALVTSDSAVLFTDSRYSEAAQVAAEATPWEIVVVRDEIRRAVCTRARELSAARLCVESSIAHSAFEAYSAAFDGAVEAVSDWVETIRCVKQPEEIDRIATAQRLTDRAFEHIVGVVAPGSSERDIALEIEFFMRREGSDGVAFSPIVASGPNSAMPHAKVTDRVLERGDFVKMDFGARVDGYCADMTRTVVLGPASERQREIYDAVLAANTAGIAAVRPGASGKAVDGAARAIIDARGFGGYFTHGLGHGVGMDVHEQPRVGPRAAETLQAGSVVTIEPGIYIGGYGGVRIEDLVVVEEGGPRVLTTSPKSLIEV